MMASQISFFSSTWNVSFALVAGGRLPAAGCSRPATAWGCPLVAPTVRRPTKGLSGSGLQWARAIVSANERTGASTGASANKRRSSWILSICISAPSAFAAAGCWRPHLSRASQIRIDGSASHARHNWLAWPGPVRPRRRSLPD